MSNALDWKRQHQYHTLLSASKPAYDNVVYILSHLYLTSSEGAEVM